MFNHVYPKQPSNGGVTFQGWVEKRRTRWEIADGSVREKGMETKEGMEGGNIRVAKGSRNGVQIEDQEGKKERKELGRWVTGDELHTCSAHQSFLVFHFFKHKGRLYLPDPMKLDITM